MKFRIADWTYTVHITDPADDLINAETNRSAAGLCTREDRRIWLNGQLPLADRLDTLFHELVHMWYGHVPPPLDEESLANWVSSFTIDVWKQFDRQGGVNALMRLKPDGALHDDALAGEDKASLASSAWSVQCPACCGVIAIGSARNSDPRWEADQDHLVIDRTVYCDRCDLTLCWTESATTAGKPSGRIIAQPTLRRGGAPKMVELAAHE